VEFRAKTAADTHHHSGMQHGYVIAADTETAADASITSITTSGLMLKTKLLKATDHVGLRRFGLSIGIALPLLLMVLLPWWFDFPMPLWPVLIPLWLLPLAAVAPNLLYYPYRLWMLFFGVIGTINTYLILSMVFIVLITPLGLVLRGLGKLQYQKRQSISATTNWQPSTPPAAHNLEEPF
jgi:hypothetical protein